MVLYPQQLPIRGVTEDTDTTVITGRLTYQPDGGQRARTIFHAFFTPSQRSFRVAWMRTSRAPVSVNPTLSASWIEAKLSSETTYSGVRPLSSR